MDKEQRGCAASDTLLCGIRPFDKDLPCAGCYHPLLASSAGTLRSPLAEDSLIYYQNFALCRMLLSVRNNAVIDNNNLVIVNKNEVNGSNNDVKKRKEKKVILALRNQHQQLLNCL